MEIDIPADIRAFLDEVVDSFVMWDLLIFCSKKNYDLQTPAQVAQMLGRQPEEVEKPARRLEGLGLIVIEKREDGESVCRLNPGSQRFSALQRFWAYNESQENRLRILSYLLHKKAR